MKLIAHRGASLLYRENTLEALVCAAQKGADAVECDILQTRDDKYILFHDPTLDRIAGDSHAIAESTLAEICDIAERGAGYRPNTLNDLKRDYHENVPLLLDIGIPANEAFLSELKSLSFPYIVGVSRREDVKAYLEFVPPERILGFIPSTDDAEAFLREGVGIIRLWEQWLDTVTPEDIRKIDPEAKVWIMSYRNGSQDGCTESIERMKALGANGVLLSDISLAKCVKA